MKIAFLVFFLFLLVSLLAEESESNSCLKLKKNTEFLKLENKKKFLTLKKGSVLKLIEKDGKYYKATFKGIKGFVAMKFVELSSDCGSSMPKSNRDSLKESHETAASRGLNEEKNSKPGQKKKEVIKQVASPERPMRMTWKLPLHVAFRMKS